MKTSMRWLLVFSLALGAVACYPESEEVGLRLSLPLSEGGLVVQEQALFDWVDWFDFEDGWDGGAEYEMSEGEKTFFLGLDLFSDLGAGFNERIPTYGTSVSYLPDSDELIVLLADPQQRDGTACLVSMSVFWIDSSGKLLTFEGSKTFTLREALSTGVDLEVQQKETGSVQVLFVGGQPAATASVAVRDAAANVRFPPLPFAPSEQGPVALFEDLPLGRDLFVEYKVSDADDFASQAAIRIETAGLLTTVEIEP